MIPHQRYENVQTHIINDRFIDKQYLAYVHREIVKGTATLELIVDHEYECCSDQKCSRFIQDRIIQIQSS